MRKVWWVAVALILAAVLSLGICDLFAPDSYWACYFGCACSSGAAGGGASGAGLP